MKWFGAAEMPEAFKSSEQMRHSKLDSDNLPWFTSVATECKNKQYPAITAHFIRAEDPTIGQVIVRGMRYGNLQAAITKLPYSIGAFMKIQRR